VSQEEPVLIESLIWHISYLLLVNFIRLFQNFSFWKDKLCLSSFLGFWGKTGLLTGFSGSLFQNRALSAHSQLALEQLIPL
jgi:hypothetical protein